MRPHIKQSNNYFWSSINTPFMRKIHRICRPTKSIVYSHIFSKSTKARSSCARSLSLRWDEMRDGFSAIHADTLR